MASDRADLTANGALFNDDGSIANYEQLMQQWIDEYNDAVEAFNNSDQTDADQDALDDAEDLYEKRKKMIENYEAAYQKYQDQINNYLETLNKLSAARLEKITYKVELQVELDESDRKIIDYFNKKIESTLEKQSERMSNYVKSHKSYEDDARSYADAIAKLEEEHQKWIDSNGTEGINDSDYAATLLDYRNKLAQVLSDMYENEQKIMQIYSDAVDLANEKVQEQTNIIQHSIDMMSNYVEILGLMGRKVDYDELEKFYDTQYQSYLDMIEVNKALRDQYKQEMEYYEAKMAAGQELSEEEQEQYKKATEAYIDAENTLVSNTKAALTAIQDAHKAHIQAIMEDLSEVNAGVHSNIQDVSDAYGYWNEQRANYLATGKQIYEVNKLNRKIESSMADSATKASKERLAALEEEIKLKSKSGKLSEYQIKQFELQYELALAL